MRIKKSTENFFRISEKKKMEIKFHELFDRRVEKDPAVTFRTLRSKQEERLIWHPKGDQDVFQWKIDIQKNHVFFADLFGESLSDLDQVKIPCRKFLATCIWTNQNVFSKSTVDATDMVKGHVKFKLTLSPLASFKTVRFVEDPSEKDETKKGVSPFLEDCVHQEMFDLALTSNQTFGQGEWIEPDINVMNTSYIDMIWCHLEGHPRMKPVPGWVDLRHLWLDFEKHTAHERFYEHSLACAAFRLGLSPGEKWTLEDRLEMLCEAAAWVARRSVYISDTVDTTPYSPGEPLKARRTIEDVDHYGFPRLGDRLEHMGDDCESLSKETLLFLVELIHLKNPKSPLVRSAQKLAQGYIWYQITGGIHRQVSTLDIYHNQGHTSKVSTGASFYRKGPTRCSCSLEKKIAKQKTGDWFSSFSDSSRKRYICHSWVMGIPKEMNAEWIARGQRLLNEPTTDFDSTAGETKKGVSPFLRPVSPVLNIESTELTTSVPGYLQRNEEALVKLHEEFRTCSAFGAFRVKLPWTCLAKMDRYAVVTTAVSVGQTLQEENALEFIFGTLSKNQEGFKKGSDWKTLFEHPEEVVLLPSLCLQDKHIRLADQALEFYPPILPIPFEESQSIAKKGGSPKKVSGLALYTREQDWPIYKETIEKWCSDYHYNFDVEVQIDFDQAKTVIVHLKRG
jgi:hypothetical protein